MRRQRPICIAHAFHAEVKSSRDIHSGILRYAQNHPDLLIRSIQPGLYYATSVNTYADARQQLRELRPDGVITHSNWLVLAPDEPPLPESIHFACVNEYNDDTTPTIPNRITGYLDERAIIRTAIDLALRRQHRNFAYVDTLIPCERSRSAMRARLYAEELAASGHALHRFSNESSSTFDENLQSLGAWLLDLSKPCMVFAYADDRARDVIDACHMAHLAIPDQINVIGIDNDAMICELVEPKLTSIQPDFELGGYLAAQALHRRILAPRTFRRDMTFTYGVKTVIERASTQDLRGGGRLVVRTQELIREKLADTSLLAPQIAKALNVSRQLLDLRFREIAGRTVRSEIERLRIEKACELLRENKKLSIAEVMSACGYNNANTFRAAFRKRTRRRPTEYRHR